MTNASRRAAWFAAVGATAACATTLLEVNDISMAPDHIIERWRRIQGELQEIVYELVALSKEAGK